MKKAKTILLTVISLLLVLAVFTGCSDRKTIDAKDVKLVTAVPSVYSSYMYVIEDTGAIKELVDFYNGLKYEPLADGEEAPDLYDGALYAIYFVNDVENGSIHGYAADFWLSPKGYVCIEDKTYKLTSDFDEEWLKNLLTTYDVGSEPTYDGDTLPTE